MQGKEGEGCWELELCGERGVLEGIGVRAPSVGDAVDIGLCLSSGERVDFPARVSRLERGADGRLAATVEFSELSVAERRAFVRWQRLITRRTGSARVRARVSPAVEFDVPSSWHQGSWRA